MLLELDVATIVFEIVNFLLLAYLLHRFFFRPVMERVQKRADEKAGLLEELRQKKDQATALRQQLDSELAGINQQADRVVEQSREQAETERMALLDNTRTEAEQIRQEAQRDASTIKQRAIIGFQEDIVDAVLDICSQVICKTIPTEVHGVLIKQLEERIWALGREEMDRVETIRQSLQHRMPTVNIISAQPLTPEQHHQLSQTFAALADHDVNLEIQVDDELIAGLRIRLGDTVMDNSVADKLDSLRDTVLTTVEQDMIYA